MELKRFLGLQVFEFAYLMALAFLPFFVAQREVGLSILTAAFIYVIFSGIQFALNRRVDTASKVVLITGCDSGFGNALARRLNSLGFTVVAGCLDKSSDGAELLKSEAQSRMHILQLDVTEDKSVHSIVGYIRDQFPGKGLWALVNNAGIMQRGDVEFLSVDAYKKVAEVNLFGTIRVTKACLPLIRLAKGRIVNMSGAAGRLSLPTMSAFSVSCYGMEAFSDALRLEMQQFGVKVVVVEPGNYYGSTGLQNRAAMPYIREDLEQQWDSASSEVQQIYGHEYIDSQYKAISEHSKTAAPNLAPVIDMLENIITHTRVKSRYLVDGSNMLSDFSNLMIRWNGWLPQQMVDNLVASDFVQKAKVSAM